jgi:hypothetical protein
MPSERLAGALSLWGKPLMTARKWFVRLVLLVLASVALVGGVMGCESTGGGGYRGSDGHIGHNH